MQYLDNIAEDLNLEITKHIDVADCNYYGIVTAAKNDKVGGWVDKNGKNTHFNSDKKFNFYHRTTRVTANLAPSSPGKKRIYNVNALLEFPVFTSCRNFDELIMDSISKNSKLTLINIDYDAYKILKFETGSSDYNFDNKYIFVVNYNALFESDLCLARDVSSSTFIC